MLKLRSHQLPTLDSIYSLSLIYCSSPTLPPCVSYSCMHCLAVFSFALLLPLTLALSTLPIFLINAMFLTPYIRLSSCNYLTCSKNIDLDSHFIVYLTLLWTSKPLNLSFWTSRNNNLFTSRTLALFVTSTLTSLDYAQFWINFQTPRLLLITSGHPQNFWYTPEILRHE